ncbi:MAG: YbgF trimerization domain-containing protein, partial [Beijerinckiaceae bacterium]
MKTLRLALAASAALFLGSPASGQDAAELLLRLDRLENLIRQLNGQVEQAQNQNRRLEEQLRRFQGDTDFRFKELEGGRGARPAPNGPAGAPAAPAAPTQPGQPPRQPRGD